ncbi:hypothetical protein PVK06_001044 [Gossypium arboreum]|uniref:Uncharacterized protein n=1 Tax=Gossypium arboreum TaxID=29729 RepID=A0ABR0R1B0_GOSAR|nr:hypothetical protein PVK06_001044 [Gossypium arboreum]
MTTAARPTWQPAKDRKVMIEAENDAVNMYCCSCVLLTKDGQDTQDELQKRNLRAELEERERRHFSSKDKSKDATNWAKRETEDGFVPRSIDADDSDVEVNSDEARFYSFPVYLDDEEALLAELERIKKEKAEEKLRQLNKI